MSDGTEQAKYYVRSMGRITGPFDVARLKKLRTRGQFGPGAEVSADKRTWRPWSSIEALQDKPEETTPALAKSDTDLRVPAGDPSRPSPLAAIWYYSIHSNTLGPVNRGDLLQLVADGTLLEDSLVYRDGMTDWMPLCDVHELSRPSKSRDKPGAASESSAPSEFRPHYANFWRRLAACVFDGMILVVIGTIFVASVVFNLIPAGFNDEQLYAAASITSVLSYWLYFAAMESSQLQATFGKLAMELRVTTMDGRRVSFGQATGRYFGKILSSLIFLIGFLMAAFTEKRQALHDMLSDCLVVDYKPTR